MRSNQFAPITEKQRSPNRIVNRQREAGGSIIRRFNELETGVKLAINESFLQNVIGGKNQISV